MSSGTYSGLSKRHGEPFGASADCLTSRRVACPSSRPCQTFPDPVPAGPREQAISFNNAENRLLALAQTHPAGRRTGTRLAWDFGEFEKPPLKTAPIPLYCPP